MWFYVKAHRLLTCSTLAAMLIAAALFFRETWIAMPQLGDGAGRGIPFPVLVLSMLGAVVTIAYSSAAFAFERSQLARRLLGYDVLGVFGLVAPGAAIAGIMSLIFIESNVSVVIRDAVAFVAVVLVLLTVVSREVAATLLVAYALAIGMFGTNGNGRPAWWALPLDRNSSPGALLFAAVLLAAAAALIELFLRPRAAQHSAAGRDS